MDWLDNTRIIALERCPRSYYWRHEKNLTKSSAISAALLYGSCVHKAFEEGLKHIKAGGTQERAYAIALDAFKSRWEEEDINNLELMEDDWRGYGSFNEAFMSWWPSTLEAISFWPNLEIVEARLAVPVPNTKDWEYRCRVDLCLSNGGSYMIVDHKTTSRSISLATNIYVNSPQITTYAWAWSRYKQKDVVIGAAYNFLHSAKRRTKTGWGKLSVDHGFVPVAVTPKILWMMEKRITQAVEEIRSRRYTNNWPLRLSQCQGRYDTCEFKLLCDNIGFDSPHDSYVEYALESGYVIEEWDPFQL